MPGCLRGAALEAGIGVGLESGSTLLIETTTNENPGILFRIHLEREKQTIAFAVNLLGMHNPQQQATVATMTK